MPGPTTPPATLLKPLHGLEPGLYENLRSFCVQDHPAYQIVFGVQDPRDPAIGVVKRLQGEFPHRDLVLAVDERPLGSNFKVANLANMMPAARHDLLIVSDADIRVGGDWLRAVTAPLADPGVGVVTCPYLARPQPNLWSRVLSQQVNEWFLPSVLVSGLGGKTVFCGGATMALRRDALEAIGGWETLADVLADDYWLGALTRARGLATVLSPYLVETGVWEAGFRQYWHHALRWSRTTRSVQPWGHAFSFLTFPVPLAALAWIGGGGPPAAVVFILALVARAMLHYVAKKSLGAEGGFSTLLLADALGFLVWCAALFGGRVRWGHKDFHIRRGGRMGEDRRR